MTTVPHTSYVLFHCIISISSLFKHFLQFLKDGCSLLYQLLLLLYLCFKGVDFFLKDSNKRTSRLIAAMDSFLIRDFIFEKVIVYFKRVWSAIRRLVRAIVIIIRPLRFTQKTRVHIGIGIIICILLYYCFNTASFSVTVPEMLYFST